MNRDLHDIDELFRSGLNGYKETPSAGVKENLDAALDKQDAEKYKKRFIIWKRLAILLLMLVAGFVLYESGIIKTGGSGGSVAKTSVPVKNDKAKDKTEPVNPINNTSVNLNTSVVVADEPAIQKENAESEQTQKEITNAPGGSVVANKNSIDNKITGPKNNRQGKKFNPFITDNNPFVSIHSSQLVEKINEAVSYDADWQISKRGITPLDKRTSVSAITNRLIKSIQPLSSVFVSNSPLKATSVSDSKNKKVKSFRPFWMATAFASYDQAGYKLDSDVPNAVSSIKFREAHEPSFSLGILFTRQIKQKWGLQSGLVYSNSAIGMKPQKTYAFVDPTGDVAYKYITSSGYAYFKPGFGPQPAVGDSLTTAEAKHTIEQISIPLAAKYTVLNRKKISITPGAGIEANFVTKANLEVDIEDTFNREIVVVRKLSGTKSFYWSFVADAEIKYKVNPKLSINLRPVFRTAISPTTKNNVVETFPHSVGIGAGVTIKF